MSELTQEDIEAVLFASEWIGAGSPKYSSVIIIDVIAKYTDFIVSKNFTFTPEDLTENFGTRPSDAPIMIKKLGGVANMGLFLPAVTGIQEQLPRPLNSNIVVPLFIAFTVMTTIAVALRMISRHRIGGGLRSFDWVTFAAHVSFVLNLLYPWVMLVIKMSLCLFYYRMTTMNYIRWGVWATGFIVIGNTIAGFFVPMFACIPINYWDDVFQVKCKSNVDRRTALTAIGAIYIFTDVLLWALPIPMVFQLKLYPRQRIMALCTFGIGALACVASGFRLDSLIKNFIPSSQTSTTILINAWTIIEMNVALICSCAPAVRALVVFYKPRVFSTAGSSSEPSGKPSSDEKKDIESQKTEPQVQVSTTNA
ncbi:hypothetical protein TWF730_007361 [Orbilia blumenaviensis]|uniref:Rhodopsin domain-containing protein n=1 Tax=Orbilia blumenaviensis TaxID=1796055 RepID=A0AAV9V9C5_9PEZI